jgi:hypothetical protein
MWASLFSLLHPSLLRTISSTFIHFPSPPNPPPISKPFRLRLTVLQQPLEKSRLLSLRNPPPPAPFISVPPETPAAKHWLSCSATRNMRRTAGRIAINQSFLSYMTE